MYLHAVNTGQFKYKHHISTLFSFILKKYIKISSHTVSIWRTELFYSFFRTLRNPVRPRNPCPRTHWGGALGWVTAPQQRASTPPELDPCPYLSPLCPGLRPPSLYPAGRCSGNHMSSCPFSDVEHVGLTQTWQDPYGGTMLAVFSASDWLSGS